MTTPVFIIAQQRSGTNLVRRSLATTGCFWDSDEIFDPKNESYWPFHAAQASKDSENSNPTSEARTQLFEQFLETHLDHEKPFTLVDVKYNSTHLLDGLWHSPVEQPALIQWLAQKKYPVIHLVRANCLESYVSLLAGHYTGRWVVGKAAARPNPIQLCLDPEETIFQIRRREREIERFRRCLAHTNHMELEYESLIDCHHGGFSYQAAQQIFNFVGSDLSATIQVPTRKTGRPIRETVKNFDDEILPALVRHGLEKYDTAPRDHVVDSGADAAAEQQDDESSETQVVTVRPRPALFYIPRVQRTKPKSQPVFVVSMQRSGSNLFRRSFATSTHFHDLNEVFDPFQEQYWPYRDRRVQENPDLAIPTAANQLDLFERFIDQTLDSNKPFTLIDVKYNSTHHLNDVWYHPGGRPILVDWLIEQKCPVIHVVRENVFENYVSNVVTHHASAEDGDSNAATTAPIHLDATNTLRSIQMFQAQIDVFRKWLEPTNHVELTYESLLDSADRLSPNVIQQMGKLVGIDDPIEVSIPTQKTARSSSEMIENFESEIAPALVRNGYGDWLADHAA